MIFNVGGSAHSKGHFPDFDFDGDWDLVDDGMVDRVQNWRIMLKSSGTITFRRLTTPVDIFCVGGGGGGYLCGGGGGYTATTKNQLLATRQPYTVTIGAGGGVGTTCGMQGGTTSFGSVISAGGGYGGYSDGQRGGDGGSGGGGQGAGRGANSTAAATVGTVNTGGGGGGGTENLTSMAGGSGIIVIRNHR